MTAPGGVRRWTLCELCGWTGDKERPHRKAWDESSECIHSTFIEVQPAARPVAACERCGNLYHKTADCDTKLDAPRRQHRIVGSLPWFDCSGEHDPWSEYQHQDAAPPASEPEEIVLCRYERWMECPFGGSEKCQAPEHATFRRKP